MVQIGDKISFIPTVSEGDETKEKGKGGKYPRKTVTGTVYYVNEAHRHFGVKWDSYGVEMRESFKF